MSASRAGKLYFSQIKNNRDWKCNANEILGVIGKAIGIVYFFSSSSGIRHDVSDFNLQIRVKHEKHDDFLAHLSQRLK